MSIVSAITTYFSHSNYATHHLKEELKKEKDQRGIQVAGATRFSSFSIHARSISRCLHLIQRCLASGTVKFDTAAVSFFHFCEGTPLLNRIRQNLSENTLSQDRCHTSKWFGVGAWNFPTKSASHSILFSTTQQVLICLSMHIQAMGNLSPTHLSTITCTGSMWNNVQAQPRMAWHSDNRSSSCHGNAVPLIFPILFRFYLKLHSYPDNRRSAPSNSIFSSQSGLQFPYLSDFIPILFTFLS